MAHPSRIRPRVAKIAALLGHGAKSLIRDRRRLETLATESPAARALIAVIHSDFHDHEWEVFSEIEGLRERLYGRGDTVEDFIEGQRDHVDTPEQRVVGEAARVSSVKPRWGRLLYALAREVRPDVCLELGSSFGISGLYVMAGLREAGSAARFITLEGSRARSEIAAENYRTLGHSDFTCVVGDFDRHLVPTLSNVPPVALTFIDGNHRLQATLRYDALVRRHAATGGVIVHDDIRWSAEMVAAWKAIQSRSGGRHVFDLFRMGLVEMGGIERRPVPIHAWLGPSFRSA